MSNSTCFSLTEFADTGTAMWTSSDLNKIPVGIAEPTSSENLGAAIQREIEQRNAEYLDFGTAAELAADDESWRATVSATTNDQIANLERAFLDEELRNGTDLLTFSDGR